MLTLLKDFQLTLYAYCQLKMAANSLIDATGNKKLNFYFILQTLCPHHFKNEYRALFW